MTEERARVEAEMVMVGAVAATVDAAGDSYAERRARFEALREAHASSESEFEQRVAKRMGAWSSGLFLDDGELEGRQDAKGRPLLPEDNYGLERWFRLVKGHARRVHGRAHAGVALVQRGATLLPTLDAHALHSGPFRADDLRPHLDAPEPEVQREARHRAVVMRRARSEKGRPVLLAELQQRYAALP